MPFQMKRSLKGDINLNHVLKDGQPAVERVTAKGNPRLKIGDGVTKYSSLPYACPDVSKYTDSGLKLPSGGPNIEFKDGSFRGQHGFRCTYEGSTADLFLGVTAPIVGSNNSHIQFDSNSLSLMIDNTGTQISLNLDKTSGLYPSTPIELGTAVKPFKSLMLGTNTSSQYEYYDGLISLPISQGYQGTPTLRLYVPVDTTSSYVVNGRITLWAQGGGSGMSGQSCVVHVHNGSMYPDINSTNSSTGYSLGTASNKWRYVYAYSGTINTSDRASKDSINYLDEPLKTRALTSNTVITTNDILQFVEKLNPATFCYKDGNEVATEDNSSPEMIQLGLIADDIKDDPVFKYVGVKQWDYNHYRLQLLH